MWFNNISVPGPVIRNECLLGRWLRDQEVPWVSTGLFSFAARKSSGPHTAGYAACPFRVGLGRGGVLPQAAANDSHPLHRIAKHLNSSADPSKARFYHQFCFHGRHGLCHELCCAAISYDARRCEWRLARPAVAA